MAAVSKNFVARSRGLLSCQSGSVELPAHPAWKARQELAGRYNLHAERFHQIGQVLISGQQKPRSRCQRGRGPGSSLKNQIASIPVDSVWVQVADETQAIFDF